MTTPPRLVLADTHVHLYEVFDLDRAFDAAFRNLGALAPFQPQTTSQPSADLVLFLAERRDSHAFERLASLKPASLRRHSLHGDPECGVIVVENREGRRLQVVAGRQVVTRDRIEVLALATRRSDLPDGEPTAETLNRLEAAGALPVLPWAPGKWFGSRGRLVTSLVESATPERLLVGDTTLRPSGWPEPRTMRTASARGLGILAGSDPFPLAGQEDLVGRYATAFHAPDGVPTSAAAWGRLIIDRAAHLSRVGRRDGPLTVMQRIVRLRRVDVA